jgi:phosphatidylserine/phosphatidylglycerophosphate/cardiolipin synthase-like enzyme
VRRAIKRAHGRGTRIALLTKSDVTTDIKAVADASRYAFYALLRQGGIVALFERLERADIGELTLHSKVASFGTCGPVIVGSANLDGQSSEHNTESVVLVDDPALRRDFDQMFETDIGPDRATRITMDLFKKSSAWDWLRQTGVYYLGSYWL